MNRKWLIHVKKFFQDGIKCKKRNIIIRKRKNTFKTTIIFILWSFIYTSRKDSFGLNNTKSLNNAGTGSYRHLDRIILIEREYWAHFPNTYRDIYRSIFWFVPFLPLSEWSVDSFTENPIENGTQICNYSSMTRSNTNDWIEDQNQNQSEYFHPMFFKKRQNLFHNTSFIFGENTCKRLPKIWSVFII